MTKIGVCSRSARSKERAANSNNSLRVFREQQHMLGVAMAGIGADQNVGLLGARRHAGGGPAALHIEDDRGNFREIGQAQKFLHQGDAGAGGGGEGARAVPARADHRADGGDFVLRLDDGEFVLSRSAASTRNFLQCLAKASATEVDGVIGYQAATVAPP